MASKTDMLKVQNDRMKLEIEKLKMMMQDDRERDIAEAKISQDAIKAQDANGR